MLGFNANFRYWKHRSDDGITICKKPVLLTVETSNVFVYCDLLEHVIVREVKAPLLRIINRKTSVRQRDDSVEHVSFNPILYVPLQKKSFDTFDIRLLTDFGEPLPFFDGKSFVVFEFRQLVHPYLLQ